MSQHNDEREASALRPRYRYLLVEVAAPPGPPREDLVRLLQATAPPQIGIWLTRYDGHWGIVRVRRDGLDAARQFFANATLPVRPVLTSGSIAGLQRKHRGARGLRQGRR